MVQASERVDLEQSPKDPSVDSFITRRHLRQRRLGQVPVHS